VRAKVLVLTAFVAATAGLVGPSAADARGYTCNYRSNDLPKVVMTMDGYDNTPALCRMWKGGPASATKVASHPGRTLCSWQAAGIYDVRLVVRATFTPHGRAFCSTLAPFMKKAGWRRVL
jgi:hypothetical protein